LTKAKVLDANEESGADARLQCDFCGATYNLRNGVPVEKEGGKLLGFLFSKGEKETLPVYGLGEKKGKVFINVP
jgi:nitrite reductase/ring-hydroxylating ferredoxin subunit